jgi:trimethylamine:corrinoid methyltransferase-like protein
LSDTYIAAERSPTVRSRITNGKDLLANVDGRTADARRYRDLAASLADDLGGASSLTEAQRALVRQAAAMLVQSERLQSAVVRGELVDVEQLTRLANAATRILTRLGVKRERPDTTPTIAEIAARHRSATA